ncbi:dipeptidyl aminopeptidase/acylaminoacyl peptidase [Inhella inkyongensis]|uniref:Dipeptidyl aminopeptidase/acylaminoacyl peptidase n=1 Tax=Inhella inkyongensis TaxID=392593 RepID=A0A840S6E7_9BURK|nr:S9 family peptidase [Inhella inkyongensis]MBB5205088.1 dipeptidyl aminopeptidase/acylaminoacyl peptidase [Inhella inkyongensis]
MKIRALALAAALAAGMTLPAAPLLAAEPVPLKTYLSSSKYISPTLSPNGRYMALLTPINGKRNLAVIDLKTRKSQSVTNISGFDVIEFDWIGNERLAFSLGQLGAPTGAEHGDGGGLFVVSRDGKEARTITPTARDQGAQGGYQSARGLSFLRSIPGNDDEFLASGNLRVVDSLDIYRVNAVTGKQTLLTFEHPGKVMSWELDNKLVPRVAVVRDRKDETMEGTSRILYRATVESPWVEVESSPLRSGEIFTPLSFDQDDKTLFVASNRGRDTTAIYRFNPETKQLGELLAAHPRYDMGVDAAGGSAGGVLQRQETGELVGFSVPAEESQISWIHNDWAQVQAQMEASFPGKNVSIQRRAGASTLVTVSSATHIPRSYLYDEKAKRLEELFVANEVLKDEHLAPTQHFLLKTRDGLEIPSMYVLPKDYKPGQKLPTVVHVHGGPHARADFGGFPSTFGTREAQILASRGYAVILPNFRVTPGFGRKIYLAGFGAIGTKMSEDHEDAVHWAVKQGFADPQRVCITGGSYGGYATLQALVKTPDLFACGVAGLSVSDFKLQLTSTSGDTVRSKPGVAHWMRMLDMGKDDSWDKVKPISPAYNVARIKAPLAMYAGRDDIRTPLEQTERVVDEMKKLGKAPEFVFIADGEAHGFGKPENNLKKYELMLDFLDRHIGSKSRFAKPQ